MRPLAYLAFGAFGALGGVVSGVLGGCVDLSNLASGAAGDGGAGGAGGGDASLAIALSPVSLDFGVAGCGTQVPPQTVNLENTGATPITYNASLPEASGFALGGQHITTTSGTVPPGGRTAFAINVASLRNLGALKTKLTLEIGGEIREVPITVTGLGAKLDVDHQLVDYGEVFYSANGVAQVTLTNPGTEDITIMSLGNLGGDFEVDKATPLPLVVPKGGNAPLKLDFVPGPAGAPLMRDITFATDDKPLCGDRPTLTLRAQHVSSTITVSPGTIDFGKQPCGLAPAGKIVTVTNYGPATAAVMASTTMVPSRFTIVGGSVSVPAAGPSGAGTATFTVQPGTVNAPIGVATENIDLRVNGAVRTLTARIDARGAILALSPLFYQFSFVGQKRIVVVTNTGNENADTIYTSSSPSFTPGPGNTIFAGGASNMEITYTPLDEFGVYVGRVTTTVALKEPLCAPVPPVDVETK